MRRVLLLLPLVLAGCEWDGIWWVPEPSLERMIDQPKKDAYEHSDAFEDHRAMRPPPEGTVARDDGDGDPVVEYGVRDGRYVEEVPIEVTERLLERGRDRFTIFCATCHGDLGDGNSPVARNMDLVKPVNLLQPRIRAYPPGRVYRVVREGFGVMPSYRAELVTRDRWAVVAYLQALQLRAGVALDALPPELQQEAKEALE